MYYVVVVYFCNPIRVCKENEMVCCCLSIIPYTTLTHSIQYTHKQQKKCEEYLKDDFKNDGILSIYIGNNSLGGASYAI